MDHLGGERGGIAFRHGGVEARPRSRDDAPSPEATVVRLGVIEEAVARVRSLKAIRPLGRVVVEAASVEAQDLRRLLDAGADAFAAAGAIPPHQAVQDHRAGAPAPEAMGLTARELEVLGFLSAGYSNKEVARRLEVSVRTVETHRFNLRRKTRSGRLRDLVRLANRMGLQADEADLRRA